MEHLRELRELKKLYQKDVAAALKIDRTTYVKYETGASEPSYEILKRIARFYDVSIDYLLDYSPNIQNIAKEPPFSLSPEEERLILDYRSFNQKGQEKIREEIYLMSMSGIYKNTDDIPDMENEIKNGR